MRRRIVGGIVGWLIGVLPLMSVNVADSFGYYFADPIIVGIIALFGGLILGGIVSGVIGGRPRRDISGGATGASVSGGIAAILYAISIITSLFIARSFDAPPPVINEHPIRISVAILFFAALLLGIAMLTGLLVGLFSARSAGESEAVSQSQPQFPPQRQPSLPRQRSLPYPQNSNGMGIPAAQQRPPYRQSGPPQYNSPQRPAAPAMPAPSRTQRDDGYAQSTRYPYDPDEDGSFGNSNDSRHMSNRQR